MQQNNETFKRLSRKIVLLIIVIHLSIIKFQTPRISLEIYEIRKLDFTIQKYTIHDSFAFTYVLKSARRLNLTIF